MEYEMINYDIRANCDICKKRRKCAIQRKKEDHSNLQTTKPKWVNCKINVCKECNTDYPYITY